MTRIRRDDAAERRRSALVVALRTLVVVVCVVVVIVARNTVGWPAVVVQLGALGVLIGVLWTYRPSYR